MMAESRTTDVLVVGGGLAGLRAALAASAEGASVMIVVKGKLGRSGCSAMTTSGYAAVFAEDQRDEVKQHVLDTRYGGGEVGNPDLVHILCQEAAETVRRLEGDGASFAKTNLGEYVRTPSGDHSARRVLCTPNNIGTDLTLPLADLLNASEVTALEYTMITDLLIKDGRCIGAKAFHTRTGESLQVDCRSVVLATGGAGKLFSITSNPNDVTGDGFALAARAGVRLRDMEFIQFYPWRCIDPFDRSRVSIQPSTFVYGARMYNAKGERFMTSFNPDGAEITTRDVAARGIFEQMRKGEGVGGGVRLDLSPLDEATFRGSNPKVAKLLEAKGIDYRGYPFIVTPEAHYFMGGIEIDRDGLTSRQGLYAAGEVAGGIHGANRLNSNALPDTQVLGARAGRAAARAALQVQIESVVECAEPETGQEPLSGDSESPEASDEQIRIRLGELQTKMWQHLGIIRSEGGLRAGLQFVKESRETLSSCPAGGTARRAWHELVSLYETANLCLTAALYRTESRGAHFREDFPAIDDDRWKASVILEMTGDSIHCFTQPAVWNDRIEVEA